jgi:hypothetical protein
MGHCAEHRAATIDCLAAPFSQDGPYLSWATPLYRRHAAQALALSMRRVRRCQARIVGEVQASEVPRAVAAAMSIASSLDMTVDDAIVLHDSNKLTLRVLPCDLLARVAPVAHQVAQFEVELAQRLAESGCPVAALEPRVEPRVYERDGFVVTLWTYYEPATQQLVASRDHTPALADADRELLGDTLRDLRRGIGERGGAEQLLHGEPLPGQRAHHEERGAVHRFRDVLPWTCRVRPRPCARRSQRALSGC